MCKHEIGYSWLLHRGEYHKGIRKSSQTSSDLLILGIAGQKQKSHYSDKTKVYTNISQIIIFHRLVTKCSVLNLILKFSQGSAMHFKSLKTI